MKIIIEEFNDINSLLNTIENRPVNDVFKTKKLSSMNIDESLWSGTRTYDESVQLFKYGYTDVLEKVKEKLNMPSKNAENMRIPRNDVVGYLPNVPNAIQGLPNSMINIKFKTGKVKTVDLIYTPVFTGELSPERFIENGVKILNVINNLELNDIRVNLKAACKYSQCEDELTLTTVLIKRYTEHLNLTKLCYPIAHPGFLRRIGFKWLETSPHVKCDWYAGGYGRSIKDDRANKKIETHLKNKSTIITLADILDKSEQEILDIILNHKKS